MKSAVIIVLALLIAGCAPKKHKDPLMDPTVVHVTLPSMVCGNCAKTIEHAVYQVEGVKEVNVDVDKKTADITFIPRQTNLETIERTINDAGYDVNDKKRDPAAYDKLDKCCKIDG